MSDIQQDRERLSQIRRTQRAAQEGVQRAARDLALLKSEHARVARSASSQSSESRARLGELSERLAAAERALSQARSERARVAREERAALAELVALADPRKSIQSLSDTAPLLLMPVRLETRFREVTIGNAKRTQLWVRVFPDECAVDGFESGLSDAEVANARAFWTDFWRAAGDEAQERAAWRALVASHGAGRAAWILQQYRPLNEGDRLEPGAVLQLPDATAAASKQSSWTQAPRCEVLPERFVLIGYAGGAKAFEVIGAPVPSQVLVGPDPSLGPDEQLKIENGELRVPEPLRWLVDFDAAVAIGLGFRVDLNESQAREGFDRLLAIGVRAGADERESAATLETLLEHHLHSRRGFSLVPQGTFTNNAEAGGADFSRAEDADDSFRAAVQGQPMFTPSSDPLARSDGEVLAAALGIRADLLQKVPYADGRDQAEAHAMNVALWPATFGYMMQSMLAPVLSAEDQERCRAFFARFVSGRGGVPAVRVGSQPYGILPTMAFSRVDWARLRDDRVGSGTHYVPPGDARFVEQLWNVLKRMDADWAAMARNVTRVGQHGDAHRILLDVLGLHASSVEYYQRWAESAESLYNRAQLQGFGAAIAAALRVIGQSAGGSSLLRELGYQGEVTPEILSKFFLETQNLLKGPIVDDRPLSSTEPVRSYATDGRNYLAWLADVAGTSVEALRVQSGFKDNQPPTALLYLMLRHALLLGYWDTSLRLHETGGLLSAQAVQAARREPAFVHVREGAESESRWAYLFKRDVRVTGDAGRLVADYITSLIGTLAESRQLDEQVRAIRLLSDAPTARLERLFAEHIDCASYRLDAWLLGLARLRLESVRGTRSSPRPGVHLGAYGWLEDVRPKNGALEPVTLSGELGKVFASPAGVPPMSEMRPMPAMPMRSGMPAMSDEQPQADASLMVDPRNGGYIHAPSLNHAITAAVLRNGYLSNASPANRDTLAVNLSSARVRMALGLLEGIRSGQSLGALLGYRFERGLHDRHGLAEVDSFIYDLRKAFPLSADQISSTRTPEGVSIEAVEARNVLDGLKLVEHVHRTGIRTYPFGKALPGASDAQKNAINAEVIQLLDVHDAVADLAMAEGVYQAVQGNYDRAAGTLEAYSKGHFPPEPAVVRSPRSGITLTHRVALHVESGVSSAVSPIAGMVMTPRASAEPALNKWLAGVLPAPEDVGVSVDYFDATTQGLATRFVSQRDLGLQPLDLLHVLDARGGQAMAEIDDRILRFIVGAVPARPDGTIQIRYTSAVTGRVTFFELSALVRPLRALLLRSRPLEPADAALHNEATMAEQGSVFVDVGRITPVRDTMNTLQGDCSTFATALNALLANPVANRAALLAGVDAQLAAFVELAARATGLGLANAGWGFAYGWRQTWFGTVLARVDELVQLWDSRLTEFTRRVSDYDSLPGSATPEERFAQLRRAERLVVASPTERPSGNLGAFRSDLDVLRARFVTKRDVLAALRLTNVRTLSGLITALNAQLPVSQFDRTGLAIDDVEEPIITFCGELASRAQAIAAEAQKRHAAAQASLVEHAAATTPSAQVSALKDAAKHLLGEDFKLLPEFDLPAARAQELENALAPAAATGLLDFLVNTQKIPLPLDEWLQGLARVRDKMHALEQVQLFADAFGQMAPQLQAAQLPFKSGDHWLGLEFPEDYKIDGDRLLYTVHMAQPFDKTQRQCGLLLDEWTEVIPGDTETTGLAFHFDQPSSEPPQSWLLVLPAAMDGAWHWEDVVDALHETLALARKRAVEPAQVDASRYAPFLPAAVSAVTLHEISIVANLALNNAALSSIRS